MRASMRMAMTSLALCGLLGVAVEARELAPRRDRDGARPVPPPAATPIDAVGLSVPGVGESFDPDLATAMTHPHRDGEGHALGRVAEFLGLRPEQVEELLGLLERRTQAALPIVHDLAESARHLRELLGRDAPPAEEIGRLVLEIRELQRSLEGVQAGFVHAFEDLLGPDQRERLRVVRIAAEIQPLLPAFRALGLL